MIRLDQDQECLRIKVKAVRAWNFPDSIHLLRTIIRREAEDGCQERSDPWIRQCKRFILFISLSLSLIPEVYSSKSTLNQTI